MAGAGLLRPESETGGVMARAPSVPSNCKVEPAAAPVLLRNWMEAAVLAALLLVMRTMPSSALVLALSTFSAPVKVLVPARIQSPAPLLVTGKAPVLIAPLTVPRPPESAAR